MPAPGGSGGGAGVFGSAKAGIEEFTLTTSSGTTYAQTISATGGSSPALVKQDSKSIAATAANTAKTTRGAQLVRLVSNNPTAQMVRGIAKRTAAGAASAASAIVSKLKFATIFVTQGSVTKAVRAAGKNVLVGASTAYQMTKAVSTHLAWNIVSAPNIFTGNFRNLAISIAAATSASLKNLPGKMLGVMQGGNAGMVRSISKSVSISATSAARVLAGYLRFLTLLVTATSLALTKRMAGKRIPVATATTLQVFKGIGKKVSLRTYSLVFAIRASLYARLIGVTQGSQMQTVRQPGKRVAVANTTLPIVLKGIFKSLFTSASNVVFASRIKMAVLIIQVLATSLAVCVKNFSRTLPFASPTFGGVLKTPVKAAKVGVNTLVGQVRGMSKNVPVSAAALPGLIKQKLAQVVILVMQGGAAGTIKVLSRTLACTAPNTTGVSKIPGKMMAMAQTVAVSVTRGMSKAFGAATTPLMAMGRTVGKALAAATTPLMTLGKGIQKSILSACNSLVILTAGRVYAKMIAFTQSTIARMSKTSMRVLQVGQSAAVLVQAVRVKVQKIQVVCAPAVTTTMNTVRRLITIFFGRGYKG